MEGIRKLDSIEARWVALLAGSGISKDIITEVYSYKPMDVYNVLRGNTYSKETGILNKAITPELYIVVSYLLATGKSYRSIARFLEIDKNITRNIQGVVAYRKRNS